MEHSHPSVAIDVQSVSKRFVIPHEKISTLKGVFVNLFKKNSNEVFDALHDVSFQVHRGEFFGIIGKNGSGKSTLLKILAGIYAPDTGSMKVNGMISPFLELGIGFNPELSGRDNVYLNATVLGLSKKEIDAKFPSIVAFSELERFIDQKVKNYSSGMQVRLAFAVAIHANREILLMDEVLAVGDANFQQKCIEEFQRYKQQGKTVVLVTHDLATLERYCDRAMLIRNGSVEYIGDPEVAVTKYMEQNASDEEARLTKEEGLHLIADSEHEPQNAQEEKVRIPLRITNVEFLDDYQKPKHVYRTKENITIRVHYQADGTYETPAFGIDVYVAEGIHVGGPNTQTSKIDVPPVTGDGYIDFIITENPFFTGMVTFSVTAFDSGTARPLDFKDHAYRCKIVSGEINQNGFIHLEHLWRTKN